MRTPPCEERGRDHLGLSNTAEFQPLYAESHKYPFVYLRTDGTEQILVSINPAGQACSATLNGWNEAKPLLVQGAVLQNGHLEMDPLSCSFDDPGGKVAIRMRRRSERRQLVAFDRLDGRVDAPPAPAQSETFRQFLGELNHGGLRHLRGATHDDLEFTNRTRLFCEGRRIPGVSEVAKSQISYRLAK
jgi:hypothetical protein